MLELAPAYYNLSEFKDAKYTRVLKRVQAKRLGKAHSAIEGQRSKSSTSANGGRESRKSKKA